MEILPEHTNRRQALLVASAPVKVSAEQEVFAR
jgi:hypothetical protein